MGGGGGGGGGHVDSENLKSWSFFAHALSHLGW